MAAIDPLLPFKFLPMDGRNARESGLWCGLGEERPIQDDGQQCLELAVD
jgi:hypothetical protein